MDILDTFPEKLHFLLSDTTAFLVPLEPLKKGSNKKLVTDPREYEWNYPHCKPTCEGRCQGCNKSGLRFLISLKDINDKIVCGYLKCE